MSSGNEIIISPEPLKPRIERLTTLPGNNLAGALRCAIANNKLHYSDLPRVDIRVNGELQPKTPEALDRCLLEGDLVVIDVRVYGDNPLRTAFQIFVQVAAAVVGTFFGPWAAAAVQVAGALLTNVLFPPNKPEQLADANDSGALRDQSNSIRRRYPMPLVLGRQRIGFDVAALGYSENIGDESWINVIFGLHYGPCTVEDIKIGETLLADYPAADYQIEYFLTPGPRNSNIYKQSKFQENLNNELDLHGVYEVGTLLPGSDRAELDVTLPNGLSFTTDKGKKQNEEVAGHIQYAVVGTEAWVNAPLPPAYNKNGGLLPAGSFYINAKTADAIRRTYSFNLPNNTSQYKVRIKAYDYDGRFDETSVWDTYWTALRSVSFKKPIVDETLACVVLRVRSSGDLNGTLPVVTGMVTPIVPIYSGGNWNTSAPSSNMAACLRWALMGPAANTKLTAAEINASCATAYTLIEANNWQAGLFITEDMSQEDLMKVCGAAGRFSTYWSGEDLCFVSDWAKPIPRQVFTHKNVSGYKYRREYQDPIHAVFVEFKNLDQSSGADEVWVYADGYTVETATQFETMRLPYACTLERAYKEGRVYLAKRELKTEVHEFNAAFDGVTATYGDRILVSHPAALYGKAAGRVVNRIFNVDKTRVTGIRVDFFAEVDPGVTYSIDVRRSDQVFVGISVVNPGAKSKIITFTASRLVADAPRKDDLVVFGETNLVTEDVEIDNFEAVDSTSVRISASPYIADLVQAAETGPIPPITTKLKPKQPTPQPRIIHARGLPDGVEILFDVIENQEVPIQGFIAKWRYSGGSWNTMPIMGSDARSFKTPPIQRPSYEAGDPDVDAKTLVDVQILTLARRGDYSTPVYFMDIIVQKSVFAPVGFDAIGVTRVSPDNSSYGAIAVICEAITAGDIQYLDVELAVFEDGALYEPAGEPLPAGNPVGDFIAVQAGEHYVVRARWRTQDNWVSAWVYVGLEGDPVLVPGGSNVSHDTVNTGGVPSTELVDRVLETEIIVQQVEQAVEDLEIIYGDTASAAASAAAAATSAAAASAQQALALGHANDAAASAVAASASQTGAETSASASAASASAASASATQAGNAATSAMASQTAAATSASNAATSATQASTSATNAAGSASSASTSATNAANSATAAGGSATAASGSASAANTSATNAGNSASAAAASAVSAASSFNAANLAAAMLMPDRYDGTTGSYFTTVLNGAPETRADRPSNATAVGFGPVREDTIPAALVDWATRGVVPAVAGRTYEIEGEIQATSITGTPTASTRFLISARALGADFADVTGTTGQVGGQLNGAVQRFKIRVSDVASPGVLSWGSAVWVRPYIRAEKGPATVTVQFRRLTIMDVTATVSAEAQATAAATSASNANTSAGAAGASATAASGSATSASTSAGSASTYAGQASTSATNAATSALAASISMGVAASTGGNYMSANPRFSNWSGTLPANYTAWSPENMVVTKVAGRNGNPNAIRIASTGTANCGFAQNGLMGASPGGEWMVIKCEITLEAGSLFGSRIYLDPLTPSGSTPKYQTWSLADTKDVTGVVRGSGVAGSTYRFSILYDARYAGVDRYDILAATRWVSGSVGAATITWHEFGVRPATAEEVAAGVELPATSATATLALSTAVDAQTKIGEAQFSATVQAGGDPGQVFVRAGPLGSVAGFIASTIKLATVVGGTVIDVFQIIGTSAHFAGKVFIGAAKQITLDPTIPAISVNIGGSTAIVGQLPNDNLISWFGPTVAVASMTKANATAWADNTGGAYFGGQIIAGTLSNGGQGTDITVPVSRTVGPFGTNGNPIAVVFSYSFARVSRRTTDTPAPANPTAQIRLYRTIAGGAETLVSTMNVSGSVLSNQNGPSDFFVNEAMSGGQTYTDTAGGTADRTYRVEVNARTLGSLPGSSIGTTTVSQRYALTTSEN